MEIKPGDFPRGRTLVPTNVNTQLSTLLAFIWLLIFSPFILADLASNGVVASSNTSSIGTQNYYREYGTEEMEKGIQGDKKNSTGGKKAAAF